MLNAEWCLILLSIAIKLIELFEYFFRVEYLLQKVEMKAENDSLLAVVSTQSDTFWDTEFRFFSL